MTDQTESANVPEFVALAAQLESLHAMHDNLRDEYLAAIADRDRLEAKVRESDALLRSTIERWQTTIADKNELRAERDRLEAKVRGITSERDHLWQHRNGHMPDCAGCDPASNTCGCGYLQGEAYRELRADRDRLVGEVRCGQLAVISLTKALGDEQDKTARLTSELAAARADAERWRFFLSTRPESTHKVINQAIDDGRSAGGEG